VQNFYPIVLPE